MFSEVLGASSGPEFLLFKRFQAIWKNIDQNIFLTGLQCATLAKMLLDFKEEIIEWAMNVLREREYLREDYRELIELAINFFGGVLFQAPGLMHIARWMSKVLFSESMDVSESISFKKEETGLQRICIYSEGLCKNVDRCI